MSAHITPEPVAAPGWTAHKAWAGAVVAALALGLPTLYLALDDGVVSAQEWLAVIIAALGVPLTGGTVYQVENKPKTGL